MRPRFMNRGRGFRRASCPIGGTASMRPRFMNRGSTGRGSPAQSTNGFNEAPIHESGKCVYGPLCRKPPPGFNEAPIHESGKGLRGGDIGPSPPLASMRPRFMNRGSGLSGFTASRTAGRFNEAPIHESGKIPLSCTLGGCGVASMRPRFMNRGRGRNPLWIKGLGATLQ